jgi:hypothetical protein
MTDWLFCYGRRNTGRSAFGRLSRLDRYIQEFPLLNATAFNSLLHATEKEVGLSAP